MEPVAQATDDDGLICAASVTQNRPKLNHAQKTLLESYKIGQQGGKGFAASDNCCSIT